MNIDVIICLRLTSHTLCKKKKKVLTLSPNVFLKLNMTYK